MQRSALLATCSKPGLNTSYITFSVMLDLAYVLTALASWVQQARWLATHTPWCILVCICHDVTCCHNLFPNLLTSGNQNRTMLKRICFPYMYTVQRYNSSAQNLPRIDSCRHK
ncbi:hypothetical protein F5B22DRAFT_265535 [Xylaria bambusicola]|uniref:uncharacterized protein n=1 Tax=Xylaria bambusicola TaxID=326684 RepID=UPI0020079A8B|nr:uncharacterized protein F5B22DRAFT_265535 [Xylaria bambusicola]KAI0526038.1 hypothetical protein F5B22DRAFT_265535 [Xylaria bambusicola]